MSKGEDILEGLAVESLITVDVPDHEVYISFNSDNDALMFEEWLFLQGFPSFAEFVDGIEGE